MSTEIDGVVVVEFPLDGEGWVAVTSPGDRVPSHGTDMLGQRFAYDFLKTDARGGQRYHPANGLRTLLLGVPTRECHAWGAVVRAPFDSQIVRAVDGIPERQRVHPLVEAVRSVAQAITFDPARISSVVGNHVIARHEGVFGVFAHLAPGSVAVKEGQTVEAGEPIGRVGHTGNSTSPHLHFQLMDAPDPLTARGVPCAFASYDVWRDGEWVSETRGIPRRRERLRRRS